MKEEFGGTHLKRHLDFLLPHSHSQPRAQLMHLVRLDDFSCLLLCFLDPLDIVPPHYTFPDPSSLLDSLKNVPPKLEGLGRRGDEVNELVARSGSGCAEESQGGCRGSGCDVYDRHPFWFNGGGEVEGGSVRGPSRAETDVANRRERNGRLRREAYRPGQVSQKERGHIGVARLEEPSPADLPTPLQFFSQQILTFVIARCPRLASPTVSLPSTGNSSQSLRDFTRRADLTETLSISIPGRRSAGGMAMPRRG